jgi:hypothetical protein
MSNSDDSLYLFRVKINHNLDKTCQTLDKTVSAESGIAESLSKIASKLPVQLQHDSTGNVES